MMSRIQKLVVFDTDNFVSMVQIDFNVFKSFDFLCVSNPVSESISILLGHFALKCKLLDSLVTENQDHYREELPNIFQIPVL